MRLLSIIATIAPSLLTLTSLAQADKDQKPKPELTVTALPSSDGKTQDLHVVIHGVTDYCSTDADTHVLRNSESIRIVRDRPQHVSRCMGTQERAFIIRDVAPGRYMVTYERMPLVAPARPIRVAWTSAVVP